MSRLAELTQNLNGTANDLTLEFSHNPASQIHTATRSNDNFAFTGHANLNRADTVNGLNQVTLSGSATMACDGRGNLTNDSVRAFAYTSENRLAGGSPAVLIVYDPIGRIFQLYNYDGTTEHYTRFDHLGGAIISEVSLNTGLLRRYVPGPNIDEPILWYEGSGTSDRRWFHADERGSIVAVSDGSGNLVGTRNRYDEYGVPDGTLTGRFGFTGQLWMPELGLSHYRARAYNPALGRFMQADPIGYWSGMNLYAYVTNDPVNFVDPSGLTEACVTFRVPGYTYTDSSGTIRVVVAYRTICWDADDAGALGSPLTRDTISSPGRVMCLNLHRCAPGTVMVPRYLPVRRPPQPCSGRVDGREVARSAIRAGAVSGIGYVVRGAVGAFIGSAAGPPGTVTGFLVTTGGVTVGGAVVSAVEQACF